MHEGSLLSLKEIELRFFSYPVCILINSSIIGPRAQECRQRVRAPVGEKKIGPQARVDRLKLFTLNRKEWLSVAGWLGLGLKELIWTIDRWYFRERWKPIQHIRAPVICTLLSPLSRRHRPCMQLIKSMQQSPSWEASKKIPAFYGTRRFVTALLNNIRWGVQIIKLLLM